ncbi:MAG: hypothetical protein K2Y22_04025 [Candidatus Obscuribacterales bacterium]|nr:hypothetical protein [Candidatus Obscuribacterales bacterium]
MIKESPKKLESAPFNRLVEAWLFRKSKRFPIAVIKDLRQQLIKQHYRCALSKAPLIFDKRKGTPIKRKGCHPLYAAIDHKVPGDTTRGFQVVCYDINDLKGHMPSDCFKALRRTKAWKQLMLNWKKQAEISISDITALKQLIPPKIIHETAAKSNEL